MSAALPESVVNFNVEAVRKDFPTLAQQVCGKPLVYLDNGASTHKPHAVIDAVSQFYCNDNSNVHRGIHTLSQRATDLFEGARETVRAFLNAEKTQEIIFTRGTTESINLVAHSFAKSLLSPGDEVVITAMEHHSNIVPWQLLEQQSGIKLKIIPINEKGELIFEQYQQLLSDKTKLVSITQLSNALGTITPLKEIIDLAHNAGAKVLVDGAQAIAHTCVDVQSLDCDFYAFSGHKIFGPTGIGVLYGKESLLDAMPPYQSGGDMIKVVSFSGTTFNDLPYKFEAGTPNIAGAIGLGAALKYVDNIGVAAMAKHEASLLEYATERLCQINGLRLIGTADHKASILSFQIEGVHASDLGTLLDHQGVAIRVGHHCAMPVMEFFGVDATARASLAFYNNQADIDTLIAAITKSVEMLQ